jgi:hypothetical protein
MSARGMNSVAFLSRPEVEPIFAEFIASQDTVLSAIDSLSLEPYALSYEQVFSIPAVVQKFAELTLQSPAEYRDRFTFDELEHRGRAKAAFNALVENKYFLGELFKGSPPKFFNFYDILPDNKNQLEYIPESPRPDLKFSFASHKNVIEAFKAAIPQILVHVPLSDLYKFPAPLDVHLKQSAAYQNMIQIAKQELIDSLTQQHVQDSLFRGLSFITFVNKVFKYCTDDEIKALCQNPGPFKNILLRHALSDDKSFNCLIGILASRFGKHNPTVPQLIISAYHELKDQLYIAPHTSYTFPVGTAGSPATDAAAVHEQKLIIVLKKFFGDEVLKETGFKDDHFPPAPPKPRTINQRQSDI